MAGCSGNNNATDHTKKSKAEAVNQQEKKNQAEEVTKTEEQTESDILSNAPKVPTDLNGFIQQQSGILVGEKNLYRSEKLKEELKKIPPLNQNATSEQLDTYFNYAYSLISKDFPDPADVIKKWEYSQSGNPKMKDPKYQFKENYNVEIILDSSGSMGNLVGGQTRMEIAKQAIKNFLKSIPKEAHVSLRVYGHKGTGQESDKKESCSAIEQVYGFEKYNEAKFNASLGKFKPSGWTPLAQSLIESKNAFEKFDAKKNTNLIYVVSDGIETCGGNPVSVAKSFGDSNVSPIINVIGFGADQEAQRQLKEVAKAANGIYTTATSPQDLADEFKQAENVLMEWKNWKDNSIKYAEGQKVNNYFDILGFTNQWSFYTDQQYNAINSVFAIMENLKLITVNQQDDLQQRSNIMEKNLRGVTKQLEQELHHLNAENLEVVKTEIEKKYNDNTK